MRTMSVNEDVNTHGGLWWRHPMRRIYHRVTLPFPVRLQSIEQGIGIAQLFRVASSRTRHITE